MKTNTSFKWSLFVTLYFCTISTLSAQLSSSGNTTNNSRITNVTFNSINDSDQENYQFRIQDSRNASLTEGPGGVTSDLQLWLKATDGLSYTDGQSVSLWEDQGRGSNATVNTVGQEPTYKDNAVDNINFNPVVDFDNTYSPVPIDSDYSYDNTSTQFLEGDFGMYTQDIFVVVIPDVTVNNTFGSMDIFCGDDDINTNVVDATGIGLGSYTARFDDEVVSYAVGTSPNVDGGYGVAEVSTGNTYTNAGIINARNNVSLTQQELYYNANNIETNQNDISGFSNVNNSRFWIGRSEGCEASTDARIAEIITFSSRKNDTDLTQERNRIQSYLALKYGITLGVNGTSQDYVSSDGTVIWDKSENAGYNYDIAGIGRDNASDLYQKQSSSINSSTDVIGQIEGILSMGLTSLYPTNNQNKSLNTINLNDKEFLVWGNNNGNLDNAPLVINVDMSQGISGLTTPVTFTGMERVWKVVENGGNVPRVQISISQNTIRNINPPGNYLMFISDTETFDSSSDYRMMKNDGLGNLLAEYDFDGTKYITFGYAPQVIVERSVYFDGSVDYIDMEDALDLNTSEFTVSAWIKRDIGSTNSSILSKRDNVYNEGYDFKINSSGQLEMSWKNSGLQQVFSDVVIPENEWHHVTAIYTSGSLNLYIDGILDKSATLSAPQATTQSFYIGAAGKNTPTAYFKGNIDEVRVWDIALSTDQLHYIMNQEIEDNSTFVSGKVLPNSLSKNEVASIPWDDLAGYYPMSIYTYTNTEDASGKGNLGALRNLDTVDNQTAPLPYVSTTNGSWNTKSTWMNGSIQPLPGSTSIVDATKTVDWNIVRTLHNISLENSTLPASNNGNLSVLGLMVDTNTLTVNGDNASNSGNGLTVTHYLNLDGKIDLQGESQLIQTDQSDLNVASSGTVEKDQQGTQDLFTYNYWSSPVGISNSTTLNNNFTVLDVLKDGTDPLVPQNINFLTTSFDGAVGPPISLADYWIWKYNNIASNTYSAWQHIRSTGSLLAGEGFTMKGTNDTAGNITQEQNYVFEGKPNNGTITLNLNSGNDYLIGNPYASAIDADEFILDNISDGPGRASTNVFNGALYFWDHFASQTHILEEYEGGYATYSLMGSTVAISNDARINATGATGLKLPKKYIPVSQGFFVFASLDTALTDITTVSGGDLTFKNSQRVFEKKGSNSIFLRNGNQNIASRNENDTRQKIKLLFSSPNNKYRQLLVGVDQNASNDFDLGYDAPQIDTNNDDMYWNISNTKFVIQAVNNFDNLQRLPIGIITHLVGDSTISIDSLENIDDNLDIYIYDSQLNIYHNLRTSDFVVNLNGGEYASRFELVFEEPNTLSTEDIVENSSFQVYYSSNNSSITVLNPNRLDLKSIELYTILGQSIYNFTEFENLNKIELNAKSLSTAAYVVKINSIDGTESKKILIN